MEKKPGGVRKGAWTTEEDILLRKCIDKYGEGKWHLVPFRAGLNRCRKSCRLRWLNYLRPDIKRGYFTRDEVDLIKRLHKLLGNRWSLIAGRLPGRTANDVKNFWNTHIDKKSAAASTSTVSGECNNCCRTKIIHNSSSNIIKPRPRHFLKPQAPVQSRDQRINKAKKPQTGEENTGKIMLSPTPKTKPRTPGDSENTKDNHEQCSSSVQENADERIRWWKNMLETTESEDMENLFLFLDKHENRLQTEGWELSLPELSEENCCWDSMGLATFFQDDIVDHGWELP